MPRPPLHGVRFGHGTYAAPVTDRIREMVDAVSVQPAGDGDGVFRARTPDWSEEERVFGGMVIAHALNAAIQTVEPSLPAHSLHAYFLRPVRTAAEVEVRVEHVRDGRSFTTRHVTMTQDGKQVLSAAASFHTEEDG